MKLPPDLERKCLELAGETPTAPPPGGRKPAELVAPGYAGPGVWLVAYEAVNESNARAWKARNRRAGQAWKAVREAVGAVGLSRLVEYALALARGYPVRARFVRVGGRRLDRLANLPGSLKGVEDAVCYLLGVDDGNPLWRPECDQEPGPGPVGVRIELTLAEGT